MSNFHCRTGQRWLEDGIKKQIRQDVRALSTDSCATRTSSCPRALPCG